MFPLLPSSLGKRGREEYEPTSFSNGYNAFTDGIRDNVARQAIINVNATVADAELEERQVDSDQQNAKVLPGAHVPGVFDFHEGTLAHSWISNQENEMVKQPEVFPSLNGISLKEYPTSYKVMENLVTWGPVVKGRKFKDPIYPDEPVAPSKGGLRTIANTGPERIPAGFFVEEYLPFYNVNEKWLPIVEPNVKWVEKNTPDGRTIVPRTRRYDPRRTEEISQRIFQTVASNLLGGKSEDAFQFLSPLTPDHASRPIIYKAARAKTQETLCNVLCGVTVLHKRGLVDILTAREQKKRKALDNFEKAIKAATNDEDMFMRAAQQLREDLVMIENQDLEMMEEVEDEVKDYATILEEREDEVQDVEKLQFVAKKLGLTKLTEQIDVEQSIKCAGDIMLSSYAKFIPEHLGDVRKVYCPRFPDSTIEGEMLNNVILSCADHSTSTAMAVAHESKRHIIGYCALSADPGEKMDVVMLNIS